MTVKSGAAWADTFVCVDGTGAFSTPSVGPAGTLYVDGVANAATVTITGSNPYKWSVTLPALTAGQRASMYISATIDGVATGNVLASEQADTVLESDTYGKVDAEVADIQARLPAALTGDGNLKVDVLKVEGTDATDAITAAAEAALASTDTTVGTIAADVTTLLSRLSAARAGYLDVLAGWTGTLRQALRAMTSKGAGEASADLTASGGTYVLTTDSLEAIRDRGDAAWTTGSSVLGTGSQTVIIECLNGAVPVDGCAVWVTTDSAGTNVVAGTLYTDAFGRVTVYLDPGTYYIWRQIAGVNYTNPQTIVVTS